MFIEVFHSFSSFKRSVYGLTLTAICPEFTQSIFFLNVSTNYYKIKEVNKNVPWKVENFSMKACNGGKNVNIPQTMKDS